MKVQLKSLAVREAERIIQNEFGTSTEHALRGLNLSTKKTKQKLVDLGVTAEDIYELFDRLVADPSDTAGFEAIVLSTLGWAAPADDLPCPPSVHPNRKRVALVLIGHIGTGLQVSAVAFRDGTETVTTVQSQGEMTDAPLTTAMNKALTTINGFRN